jgi:RNA polymerase sigma-70 factor (ECF subfamily)
MADRDAGPVGGLQQVFLDRRPMLLRLLTARLGNADDAEDAVQDLWVKLDGLAGQSQPLSGPIADPAAFLYRMAANHANDRRIAGTRRTVRDDAWQGVQPDASEQPDAERVLIARDRLRVLEATIAGMPDRMQAALRLFRVEQKPQRAIAAELGITVSGVEKLLRRAYQQINAARDAETLLPHRQGGEGGSDL